MLTYAQYDTPLGWISVGYETDTILSVRFGTTAIHRPCPVSDLAAAQIREYLEGTGKEFSFPIRTCGTPFQELVWEELRRIPYGETRTYGQIAAAIGKPSAARAVGMACNKNPIWIAIPCHRVLGKNASLTGYAGGLELKRKLLKLEQNHL